AHAEHNSCDEDNSRRPQYDTKRVDRYTADARHGTPRDRGDFEIANETPAVPRIDTGCGVGVDRLKPLVERRGILGLEARANVRIVRRRREVEAIEQRADVQTGAADD